MTMVDDATGKFHALFTSDEGTVAAMRMVGTWIGEYGIPRSIYADRLKVYVTDREPTVEEQLDGQEPPHSTSVAGQAIGWAFGSLPRTPRKPRGAWRTNTS